MTEEFHVTYVHT